MRIYMKDLRALGWCSRGGRLVAEKHGLSWSKFLEEGMELDDLIAVVDPHFGEILEERYGQRRR